MRLAALYDIHGNLPALRAVLDEIRLEGVDEIVVGGDVVPGPMAGECLAALQGLSVPVRYLYGNGERNVLAAHRDEELGRVPQAFHEAIRWVARQLSAEQLADLASWPLTVELEIPGLGDVLFCHATPRDENEIFTRLTPEDRLRPLFEATDAALVICGHTHMQFDRRVGQVRVVNAGSVGMPFGEPGAYWTLLGPQGVQPRHTTYDLEAAATRLAATGYPGPFEIRRPRSEAEMTQVFEASALR
jgi:predicted phosphodiesterase